MRRVTGSDVIIDKMISGDNEIIFDLISLIRSDADAMIYTDDKLYLTAQSNPFTPLWVCTIGKPDAVAQEELKGILTKAIEDNDKVHIIGFEDDLESVFEGMNESYSFLEYMPMNVYACREIKKVECKGMVVSPKVEYKKRMASLIRQMAKDAEEYEMTDKEAENIADTFVNSQDMFLWKDSDVVAMARIAHKDKKFARINTVVTDRKYRGNCYAKMLVCEISKKLLGQELIPMLYADDRNPYSNSVYQKIGYEKIGEVTEYKVVVGTESL